MEQITLLCELLESLGCAYSRDESMKEHITFKVGGPADVFIRPATDVQCQKIITFCGEKNIPLHSMGGGSNLIVHDFGVRGAVLATGGLNELELLEGLRIRCGAGVKLSRLCSFALEHSLTGLEFAWGIPAYDGCFKDVLESVTHITREGEMEEWTAAQAKLSYRSSAYQKQPHLITGMILQLKPGSQEAICNTIDDLMNRRREKQPLEYPSAGSTFKRPQGYFAGALIEQAGLKGFALGGAKVSEKHAGFIVNYDNATSSDILCLMEKVQQEVFDLSGVMLESEVRIMK